MEAGQTIAGKYRLNRMIGAGGMASVWSATNIFTEREFAIKFMLPQMARTPEAARRFLLEAKVSARINHPNIIEVIDVGQAEDGSLFLVMELLTGQSLDVAIRRRRPPMLIRDFVAILLECARALAAAHKSGVIHRDLKPTNIFVHQDRDGHGVAKILDFGVSKILEEEKNTQLTIAGTVLGSPLYMSPEQAMGAPGIDGRTDIFAFGSIMFEALTGQRAFDAPNFNALIVTIATQQPLRIDDVAPALPESLKSIVRECMVTDKNRRMTSFDVIVERLAIALPQLEDSQERLPSTLLGEGPPSDPDATNAMPMVRSSERPPPPSAASLQATSPGGPSSGPRSGNSPAPWATPGGSAASAATTTMSTRGPGIGIVIGAGGAVAAMTIILLVILLATRGGDAPAPSPAAPTSSVARAKAIIGATVASAAPTASAPVPSEPPVINIDQLPYAPGGRPNAPATAAPTATPTTTASAPKAMGHLSVAAGPGWCSVSVDGVRQGDTPIAGLAISAGSHRVECTPPKGKMRSVTLNVQDGLTARYRFTLDD